MTRRTLFIIGLSMLVAGVAVPASRWLLGRIDGWRYPYCDIATLGSFPLDPINGQDADLPVGVRTLDGRRVRVDGFAFAANNSSTGSTCLLRNDLAYKFTGPPLAQQIITVRADRHTRFGGMNESGDSELS